MKKLTKKIFGFLVTMSMIMSLTGMSISAETNETKTFYPGEVYRWNNQEFTGSGYCHINGSLHMIVQFVSGDNSGVRIKSATLELGLADNSGWKYDSTKTYTADIDCLYNNDWDTTTSYADLTKNILDGETITEASVDNSTDTLKIGYINADVTDMVKKGIKDGKITFMVSKNEVSEQLVFHRDHKRVKLNITYYTDEEFVPVLNTATEENINEIIAGLESGYVNLYNGLVHKEYIIDTLLGRNDYESVADFVETFETAYLDYMADPEPEDAKGTTVTYNRVDFGSAATNNTNGIRFNYAHVGNYDVVRALLKFNVGNINKEYVRSVKLSYEIEDFFPNPSNYWENYDPTEDYTTVVDAISSEWISSPVSTAVEELPELSKSENTIKKEGFVEETEISKTYKQTEYETYAILEADVTEDFMNRDITGGNISYMLRKMQKPGYVLSTECDATLTIEYLNDAEILEKINASETGEEIAEILDSGLFNDNEIYKAYAELNNKLVINNALLAGIEYESMEAFKAALKDAYESYMKNPSSEDMPGKTYRIMADAKGGMDSGMQIKDTFPMVGGGYNIKYLIKTDISEINPKYVRSIKLYYPMSNNYGSVWTYSPDNTYAVSVSRTLPTWKVGDNSTVTNATGFVEKSKFATMVNNGEKALVGDVTEDVLSQIEEGDEKVSYLLETQLEHATVNAAYIDSKGFIGLEVELINDYELIQLINKAETGEEIAEIISEGFFDGNEAYEKYAKLNNKTTVNEALVGTYEDKEAFIAALDRAYSDYVKNPSYEDKAGLTKTISFVEYGKTDASQKPNILVDYVSIGSYGTERALIKFNLGDLNRDYVRKATLTYKLKDKFSSWYTYDPEKDYSAEVLGISSDWTAIPYNQTTDIPEKAKYANTLGVAGFIENSAAATSYKKTENTTYAVMGADITEDFLSREITDGNISYMLKRAAGNGGCVITGDSAYSIEIEYLNEYELLEKYKSVKDDNSALVEYIKEIAKIEELTDVTPSIAAIFVGGKDYASYTDLLDAITDSANGANMVVADENVVVGDEITGTFTVKNFNEGDETDLFYAVVASYTDDNEMLESYIIDMDGEAIEIDQMYYDEDEGGYVIGESDELSFTLSENAADVANIKVFLWDGFGTMKPYGDATVIYSK